MDFPFVGCREEFDYQRRLVGLLADVRIWPEVSTLVAKDLIVLPEDLGRFYFLTRREYWAREFHFEASERERQQFFADWQNV